MVSAWILIVDANSHDHWPFGICTEKTILRIPLKKKKKKIVGTASSVHVYSGHPWILRASELLVSWFFQYTNLQHREKKKKRGSFSNKDPCSNRKSGSSSSVVVVVAVVVV